MDKYDFKVNDFLLPLEEFLKLIEGKDVNELKFSYEPLFFELIEYKRIDIIERLIGEYNLNVNVKNQYNGTPLHSACIFRGDIEKSNLFLAKSGNVNARNNIKMAELLLDNGADINAKEDSGGTPLRKACSNFSFEMIEFLLQRGAKVKYENDIPECTKYSAMKNPEENEKIVKLIESYKGKNIKSARRD